MEPDNNFDEMILDAHKLKDHIGSRKWHSIEYSEHSESGQRKLTEIKRTGRFLLINTIRLGSAWESRKIEAIIFNNYTILLPYNSEKLLDKYIVLDGDGILTIGCLFKIDFDMLSQPV